MKDDKYYLDLESEGYYKTVDKRGKDYREYKEWLVKKDDRYNTIKENVEAKNSSSKGLGDIVDAITTVTGIKAVVEAIKGDDDCGCDERKAKWNTIEIWKGKKINCIEKDDFNWITDFIGLNKTLITFDEREEVVRIYNNIFNTRQKNTKCTSCYNGLIRNIKKYLENYS